MLDHHLAFEWQPSATLKTLRERATLIAKIREFFAARDVLEVDTPLMSHATVTDPYVIGIPALFKRLHSPEVTTLYLQTSPEYAMKRLLAAGSGAIYQLCKVFRQGDIGRAHNPEFTMLEWYRPGFDHHDLMAEMDALLQYVVGSLPAERMTYAEAYEKFLGINPHTASLSELVDCARAENLNLSASLEQADLDTILNLLQSHCIEPQIGHDRPVFIYDFPVCQAALAKIRREEPPVASRFEVYFKGFELANGFHELQDAVEQAQRFQNDLVYRSQNNIPAVPVDGRLLAALQSGIPDCAGVALGVDRLVMLATQSETIAEVISFDHSRA